MVLRWSAVQCTHNFLSVYLQQNADLQFRAKALDPLSRFTPSEIELASELNLRPALAERG